MTSKQLLQIEKFAKPFYKKTGKYHEWDHVLLTKKWALTLVKDYKKANKDLLVAAVYLHDIGRSVRDEGHPAQSMKIARPFLQQIGLTIDDIEIIKDAVVHHDKDKIKQSESIEAKILFDADKLQILTVFGFIRCLAWLIEERNMVISDAVNFLWKYCLEVRDNYIQTPRGRREVDKQTPLLKRVVKEFNSWQTI